MDRAQKSGISVAPNESKIRGTLISIESGPDGIGSAWKVKVNESQDVNNMRNFTRPHIGQSILILVHPEMKKKFKESDLIEARVFFQGDERSGAFFLIDDDVQRL